MDVESRKPEIIEKIGRFLLFRAVVYLLPVFYAVRLILMVVTPQAYHMPGWRIVLWQGVRDGSVVLMLLYWQRYFANYTARRASLHLRRRDAWELPLVTCLYLSLDLPALYELQWPLAVFISVSVGVTLCAWEMRIIKGLEGAASGTNLKQ